jgi:exopolysaccharide biosynthesis polyprenyl glycosylphosphotransferase
MSSTSERVSRFQRPSSRAADAALVLPPELRAKAPPAPRGLARLIRSFAVILFGDVVATLLGVVLADRLDVATISYVVLLPAWLGLLGLYRIRVAPTVQTDLVPLLGALACPTFVLALIRTPGTEGLLHDVPITAGLVVLGRLVSYQVLRTVRSHSRYTEPTLIVGAGALGCQLAKALLDHPEYGMKPVGFLDGFPDDGTLPVPMVGDIDAFDEVLRSTGAKRVIVAFGANREADLVAVLRASALADVEVHIMPRLFEIGVTPSGPDTDNIWGFPLLHARRAALRTPAWRTKRVVDVIVSTTVLVLCSPLFAAVAILVKLSSPGPVLFRQPRLGQRGEVMEIYKFRSMRLNDESDTRWGSRTDDRVTRIGRLIRASSIDELPQLINVLKGDMSLVGPRPERPHFASQFDQNILRYRDRLRVPVGLTGWAQVHGLRGDTSIEERARFDNYYIEHWSLWFDLVILARTASQVVKELWNSVRPKQARKS